MSDLNLETAIADILASAEKGKLLPDTGSYDELHELQSLAEYIDFNDVELLEAAGVPEFSDMDA